MQLIINFHFKLDYPLYVLYKVYRVCVLNSLTDRLIFMVLISHCYMSHYVPFIGLLSFNKIKRLISSVILKNKSCIDLKSIFVNKFSLGTLFKFKDSLNINIKSHVEYGFNCMNCTACYIGV